MDKTQDSSKVSIKELRQFGVIMGVFIVLFFGLLIPWIWGLSFSTWPWIASAVFAGLAVVIPVVLKPIYSVWMKLAHVLGWINTRLLLSLVFYLIILPIGVILRLSGKDPMHRKLDPELQTYRVKSKQPSIDHLEKPF